MIAIDTNVLIYAIDLEDLTKHDQAKVLLDSLATVRRASTLASTPFTAKT